MRIKYWFWKLLGRCGFCHKPLARNFDACGLCLRWQRAIKEGEEAVVPFVVLERAFTPQERMNYWDGVMPGKDWKNYRQEVVCDGEVHWPPKKEGRIDG